MSGPAIIIIVFSSIKLLVHAVLDGEKMAAAPYNFKAVLFIQVTFHALLYCGGFFNC